MGETRRSFDPDFRAGAVRIVHETGKSIASVAKDLGINAGMRANHIPDLQELWATRVPDRVEGSTR
ncbi:transposase [Streptosporangium canum]|uniref:transposase n=1 Tax=Streptosporangium canum TaxID=324952 RepID=UPI00343F35EF